MAEVEDMVDLLGHLGGILMLRHKSHTAFFGDSLQPKKGGMLQSNEWNKASRLIRESRCIGIDIHRFDQINMQR